MASFPFVHPPIIKSNENNNLRFKILPFVLMKLDRGVTTVLFHFLNFVQLLKHNWHTDKKKSSIVLTLGHIAGKEKRNTESCVRKGRAKDKELCQEGKKETFLIDISSMAP